MAMKCLHPILVRGNTVPCYQCINCRINRSTAWKTRLLYELENWSDASFITLTYSTEGLIDLERRTGEPVNCLNKAELQNFFKRLRKRLKIPIKYYAVGEYGTKRKRCHFHAIVFGVSPWLESHRTAIANAWLPRCEEWQFDASRGDKSAIQNVTPYDIEYVTGYVTEKLTGSLGVKEYGKRTPPFSIMSKGLGLDFAAKNEKRLRKGWTYTPNGKRVNLPRYFRDKLGIESQIPQKAPGLMREEFELSIERFYVQYPSCRNHPEQAARLYEWWLDKNQFALANDVYEDFQRRQIR